MGYWFQGVFAAVAEEATIANVCREIHDIWPQARCRRILSPFQGVGVSRTADGFADHVAQARLDEQLKLWTPRFPDLTFVRIEAVCFGGECDYEGAVWSNGHVLRQEEGDDRGMEPLISLLRYLGIDSSDGYFEPLTRGYFD